MTNLEFKIGILNINPNRLLFEESNPYKAAHKFVVEKQDNNVIAIYVGQKLCHAEVANQFKLQKNRIVGAGSFYLDYENKLVLNDSSSIYDAIPKEIAQKFAELIVPELEKHHVKVNGIAVKPEEHLMHQYWRDLGFGKEFAK